MKGARAKALVLFMRRWKNLTVSATYKYILIYIHVYFCNFQILEFFQILAATIFPKFFVSEFSENLKFDFLRI